MAKKVLVVDDEKLIVKGIRFSLEQEGFEVSCAYDGEEALEMAKETEYDIILLDLMLPKLSGLEVCQQIRGFSNVPIIMLTAKGEDMDKILGLEYGADDYITKPFNILEVKARIKAIIRNQLVHDKLLVAPHEHRPQPTDILKEGIFGQCQQLVLGKRLVVGFPFIAFSPVLVVIGGVGLFVLDERCYCRLEFCIIHCFFFLSHV